jgi:hypothetical protein
LISVPQITVQNKASFWVIYLINMTQFDLEPRPGTPTYSTGHLKGFDREDAKFSLRNPKWNLVAYIKVTHNVFEPPWRVQPFRAALVARKCDCPVPGELRRRVYFLPRPIDNDAPIRNCSD